MNISDTKSKMRPAGRLSSVDFWRGVVLLMIFVDHVPENPFARLTFRNFSFADAAEAFVFLSGLVLAYVCWPTLQRDDFAGTARRCLKRAGQLYGAHLALTLGAIVLFGLGFIFGGPSALVSADNRALAFDDPAEALPGMLLLGYQLGFFNILPVYIVMMLLAPLLLWLTHRNVILALALSLGMYGLARFGYWPPNWGGTFSWFLNPFAWQLIFTFGMIAGGVARRGGMPYSRPLFLLCLAVVVFGALFMTGLLPRSWLEIEPYLDTEKGILGFGRLASFLSLAYVIGQIRLGDLLLKIPGMGEVARLGRQSLSIFAGGSILSALATILLSFPQASGNLLAFDIMAMLTIPAGAALLFGLARYLEWRQASVTGRIPGPVKVLGVRG